MTQPLSPVEEYELYRAAQAAEYGTYVAKGPIDIGGVRAFNANDPVPVGHVERGLVDQSQVERRADAAAPDASAPDGSPPAPVKAAPAKATAPAVANDADKDA